MASKKITEKITVTVGATIPTGNYANIKLEINIETEVLSENGAERDSVIAGMQVQASKAIGHQLAQMLTETQGNAKHAVKALVPAQHQKTILANPAAVHFLRLVTGEYPASVLELEAENEKPATPMMENTFPDEATMPDDFEPDPGPFGEF